jgi:hypothetical protein
MAAVCKEIKSFSRTHERIADLFSLMAVVLLFGSVWAILTHYQQVLSWIAQDVLLHTALVVGALILNVALIFGLLAVGAARFSGDDERCFGTFAGRRNFKPKAGLIGSWIGHMENVGKKHR